MSAYIHTNKSTDKHRRTSHVTQDCLNFLGEDLLLHVSVDDFDLLLHSLLDRVDVLTHHTTPQTARAKHTYTISPPHSEWNMET